MERQILKGLTIRPDISQTHDEEHSDLDDCCSLIAVGGKGCGQAGEDQQGKGLDCEASDEKLTPSEPIHRERVDEDQEKLQHSLNAVDCQSLASRVPAERLIDESGVHGDSGDSSELLQSHGINSIQ